MSEQLTFDFGPDWELPHLVLVASPPSDEQDEEPPSDRPDEEQQLALVV